MLCKLHNLKPALIHLKWCDASKRKHTACSCSRLGISLLQFITPMAREGNQGATAGDVREDLAGPATAGRETAVLGPSGVWWMEKRLEVATRTSCHLCQTSASLFESSCSYLYASVHVKGLYTKVMTKEERFMIHMSLDMVLRYNNVIIVFVTCFKVANLLVVWVLWGVQNVQWCRF